MIEIGQDATGRWAYMIRDSEGRVVASDDYFDMAEQAMTFALHKRGRLINDGTLAEGETG